MWPSLVSHISMCSSWNLNFLGAPWYLNATGFGVIFSAMKDDDDVILSAQKEAKISHLYVERPKSGLYGIQTDNKMGLN